MPTLPLPDDLREMLARPNPCTVTTLRSSGQPVSVATWYLLEGDRILVNMDATRRRLQHLRSDPRIALTVLDSEDWYTHVSFIGEVEEFTDDEDLVDIDRLAHHYTGKPYRNREDPRVNAWVRIDVWHGWGAART